MKKVYRFQKKYLKTTVEEHHILLKKNQIDKALQVICRIHLMNLYLKKDLHRGAKITNLLEKNIG